MRTELLLLLPENESFCNNKKAFIEFLKIDDLLSISGQRISYRKTAKSKDLVSAHFIIETNKVKSKQERYFLLTLECENDTLLDEFSELSDRIRTISERISPGTMSINILWDDIGRIYAEKSYPLINEVENLLRRLIAKFMLITVGINWSKDAIHPELFKKIENYDDSEPYINDLYKLDFIHLNQVLFEKKRDISLEDFDRLLSKTNFNDEDKEKIKRYIPKSNWEKYFSSLINDKESSLEKKWELLYKLRNKVAHNRHIKKIEHEQIKGLTSRIKEIINEASAKLGEINLNETDRELIIYSYNSDSPGAIGYLAEKAIAEFYVKNGYEVTPTKNFPFDPFDFIAIKGESKIAVEVKIVSSRSFLWIMKRTLEKLKPAIQQIEEGMLTKINITFILRDDDIDYPLSHITQYVQDLTKEFGKNIEITFGKTNEENLFMPLKLSEVFS
ncbi:MAG: hypothetical protein V4525_13420 [Pseudomonadota bacterium]